MMVRSESNSSHTHNQDLLTDDEKKDLSEKLKKFARFNMGTVCQNVNEVKKLADDALNKNSYINTPYFPVALKFLCNHIIMPENVFELDKNMSTEKFFKKQKKLALLEEELDILKEERKLLTASWGSSAENLRLLDRKIAVQNKKIDLASSSLINRYWFNFSEKDVTALDQVSTWISENFHDVDCIKLVLGSLNHLIAVETGEFKSQFKC